MRKRRSTIGPAALLAALLLGCGTDDGAVRDRAEAPLPGWALDPKAHPHPDCDPDATVLAVGRSEVSLDAADQAARGNVARQLKSQITVEVNRVVRVSSEDDAAYRKMEQQITDQATFDHGELIAARASAESGGAYFVLACLDKAAAYERVKMSVGAPKAIFDEAAARAEEALTEGDNRKFVDSYRAARAQVARVSSAYALLSVLSGDPTGDEAAFSRRWQALVKHAQALRSRAHLNLVWRADGFDPQHSKAAQERFRQVLSATGIATTLTDDACADKGPSTYAVVVSAQANCKWGTLGHTCRPTYDVEGRACASEPPRVLFQTSVPGGAGSHSRDVNKALAKAVNKLDVTAVERLIGEQIAAELPSEI